MGDRLRAGKLSRYVTSHPGQLSLAILPWVGTVSTSYWEGNRGSVVTPAMRHIISGLYALNGLCHSFWGIYLSICLSIYLKGQDYGDVSAGAQQGRLTMSR